MNKNHNVPTRINVLISYVICINACAFTRNSLKIILWYMCRDYYNDIAIVTLFNIAAYLIMFLCGCLAGILINKKVILHASLAAALGVIFTYLISGASPSEYRLIIEGSITGLILGGMGGGCVMMIRKINGT